MKTADFNRLIVLADQELRISNMYADGNIAETYNGQSFVVALQQLRFDLFHRR